MLARVIAAPEVELLLSVVFVGVPAFVVGQRRGVEAPGIAFVPYVGAWIVILRSIGRSGWLAVLALIPIVALGLYIWAAFTVPAGHERTRWWALPFSSPERHRCVLGVRVHLGASRAVEPAHPRGRAAARGQMLVSSTIWVESLVRGITPGRLVAEAFPAPSSRPRDPPSMSPSVAEEPITSLSGLLHSQAAPAQKPGPRACRASVSPKARPAEAELVPNSVEILKGGPPSPPAARAGGDRVQSMRRTAWTSIKASGSRSERSSRG